MKFIVTTTVLLIAIIMGHWVAGWSRFATTNQ